MSEQFHENKSDGEPTQPLKAIRTSLSEQSNTQLQHEEHHNSIDNPYEEPVYREHVSGPLTWHPMQQPFPSAPYQPQQGAPSQQPSAQAPWQGYQPPNQGTMPPPQGTPPQQQQPANGYGARPAGPNGYNYGNYSQAPSYPAPYGYGYPSYPNYQGYYPYGYPYPYAWQPAKPKRDGYLLGMAIVSLIGGGLVLLGGLACLLILLVFAFVPNSNSIGASGLLSGEVLFTALAIAGTIGGSYSVYHSIRSLLRKPSAEFKLPWFWLFLVGYLLLIAIGAVLLVNGQSVANIPLTIVLIALAGILPALTILALGVRRLHFPRTMHWPTTWRRFTLAIVSGATLAIILASVFELILTAVAVTSLGVNGFSLDNPNQPIPHDPRAIAVLFIILSVIAPLVEEAVKPLAVVILIGRVRSALEAFVLGLAGGIGFDLIETSGYISQGYRDWLDVAIQRSSAGLLHGLGAAMVALGWYFLTHPKESKHRFLLALGCWGYAVLQHAIWNGSFVLQLLPAPVGPYLDTGTITIGSFSAPSFILVYIVETILMLIFFFFVTGKLRKRQPPQEKVTAKEEARPQVAVQ